MFLSETCEIAKGKAQTPGIPTPERRHLQQNAEGNSWWKATEYTKNV